MCVCMCVCVCAEAVFSFYEEVNALTNAKETERKVGKDSPDALKRQMVFTAVQLSLQRHSGQFEWCRKQVALASAPNATGESEKERRRG